MSQTLKGIAVPSANFAEAIQLDDVGREATGKLDPKRRGAPGEFMTASATAGFMASLFRNRPDKVDLLDPGAGIGSLTEAFSREFAKRKSKRAKLSVRAYEIEPVLARYLHGQLNRMAAESASTELVERDFIREGAFALSFGGNENGRQD